MDERITIVGGGLAGLSLGIGLRQRGAPVTIWEVGNYPRHRVCGEFICGSGLSSLSRLGLLDSLRKAGACSPGSAAFFDCRRAFPIRPLPQAALGISRFLLDKWLADEFLRVGGELRVGERWRGEFAPGIVRASGRRIEPVVDGWRWFGLKAHATGVSITSDLEMHFVPSGYVGLCRLGGGQVNICGLFRSKTPVSSLAQSWRDWLAGPMDSVLHSHLAGARWQEESFCTVAGFSLRPQRAAAQVECCVGDALTMIPPLTGNGMSMAFESAELAIEPLLKFSRGQMTWSKARQQVAQACDMSFTRRLWWAGWLQQGLLHPAARAVLLFMATHSAQLWRAVVGRTR